MPPAAAVVQLTEPHLSIYRAVPPAGPGVCDLCHGAPNPGYTRCWSCDQAVRAVSHPVTRVVPISLYKIPGQLHTVLRNYKDGATDGERVSFTLQVGATAARFLAAHERCLRGGAPAWDAVVTVPSTSGRRPGPHPLQVALAALLPEPFRAQVATLLRRGGGPIDHNQPNEGAFAAEPAAAGRRVLLVDDTLTTGARLQSAASALALGGATVVAALAVGRIIDPGHSDLTRALWDRSGRLQFSFGNCCLEGEPPRLALDLDAD